MRDVELEAAGGVVRRTDGRVGVAHRPAYDDWVLPKGKLAAGEHVLVAARREVVEETGADAVLGRSLGEVRYVGPGGLPKRVRYWAMAARSAVEPASPDEVDDVRWLPLAEARALLTHALDVEVLDRYARGPATTTTLLVVRHASAGEPQTWTGDDRLRPLDDLGVAQAEAVRDVLDVFAPRRVVSGDVSRCVETVRPFADGAGLPVEADPLFTEDVYWGREDEALARVAELAAGPSCLLCSQGGVIPDLVERLLATARLPVPQHPLPAKKGSAWVLSFTGGTLVDADYHARLLLA